MIQPSRNRRRRKSRRAYNRAPVLPAAAVPSKPGDEVEVQTPPAAPASPPALPPPPHLTKRQIMAKLDELGAEYNPRANHAALTAALWAAEMSLDG